MLIQQQFKKISFFETIPKGILAKIDPGIIREYRRLAAAIGPQLIGDDRIFKIFVLIKLMTPPQEWIDNPSSLSTPEVLDFRFNLRQIFSFHCLVYTLQANFMKMYCKTFTLLKRRVLWETFLNSGITDENALMKAVEKNYSFFVENLGNIDRMSEVIFSNILPRNFGTNLKSLGTNQ